MSERSKGPQKEKRRSSTYSELRTRHDTVRTSLVARKNTVSSKKEGTTPRNSKSSGRNTPKTPTGRASASASAENFANSDVRIEITKPSELRERLRLQEEQDIANKVDRKETSDDLLDDSMDRLSFTETSERNDMGSRSSSQTVLGDLSKSHYHSLQIITKVGTERPQDMKVLQLMEMGFPLVQAEIAVEQIPLNDGVERAVQFLVEPHPDVDLLHSEIDELKERRSQEKYREMSRTAEVSVRNWNEKFPEEPRSTLSRTANALEKIKTCEICFDETLVGNFISGPCGHGACQDCLLGHYTSRIKDGDVQLTCFGYDDAPCEREIEEKEIMEVISLDPTLVVKYEKFKKNLEIARNPNTRWCTKPGCETPLQGDDIKPKLKCPACKTYTCSLCKEPWHRGACDNFVDKKFKEWSKKEGLSRVQKCPCCLIPIQKNGGCNHMLCHNCRYQFCWLCRRKYTFDHYAPNNKDGCAEMQFRDTFNETELKKHNLSAEEDARAAAKKFKRQQAYEGRECCLFFQPYCITILTQYNHFFIPCVFPLLLVFTVLALYHLEYKTESEHINWIACIPLLVATFLVFLGFACVLWARLVRWRENPIYHADGFIPQILVKLRDYNDDVVTRLFWTIFWSCTIFLVLLPFLITKTIEFPSQWVVLFAPLILSHVVFILYTLQMVYRYDNTQLLAIPGFASFLLIFLVFCVIRLEFGMPMWAVFIPIFLLIVIFGGAFISFLYSDDEVRISYLSAILLTPVLLFCVLFVLLHDANTGLSYWTTFIPFFILQALCCCGCMSYQSLVLHEYIS